MQQLCACFVCKIEKRGKTINKGTQMKEPEYGAEHTSLLLCLPCTNEDITLKHSLPLQNRFKWRKIQNQRIFTTTSQWQHNFLMLCRHRHFLSEHTTSRIRNHEHRFIAAHKQLLLIIDTDYSNFNVN